MRITVLLFLIVLSGCAAPVFKVELAKNEAIGSYNDVTVRDGRLDKQLYMNGISYGSASHIYLLETNPPIEEVVKRVVRTQLRKANASSLVAEITIEELDLKNKVGFAKADELYCKIESTVSMIVKQGQRKALVVKTFSKNDENMSPFVKTSAKVILDQCLHQHSVDLANRILTEG